MSGVNWTRAESSPSARAEAFAIRVLAVPGTPSSSTCPRAARPITIASITSPWPATTLATSPAIASFSSFSFTPPPTISRRTRASARAALIAASGSSSGPASATASSSGTPAWRARAASISASVPTGPPLRRAIPSRAARRTGSDARPRSPRRASTRAIASM